MVQVTTLTYQGQELCNPNCHCCCGTHSVCSAEKNIQFRFYITKCSSIIFITVFVHGSKLILEVCSQSYWQLKSRVSHNRPKVNFKCLRKVCHVALKHHTWLTMTIHRNKDYCKCSISLNGLKKYCLKCAKLIWHWESQQT